MTAPAPLLILHLSDLHFGNHNRFADQDPRKLGSAFSRAIDHARGAEGIVAPVQLVIVSGDAVELGKPKEFEQAEAFLVALSEQFGLDATRFVFAPGNHDLSWPLCKNVVNDQEIEDFDETELRQRMDAVKFKFYDQMLARFYGQPLGGGRRSASFGQRGLAARFFGPAAVGGGVEHLRTRITSPEKTMEAI